MGPSHGRPGGQPAAGHRLLPGSPALPHPRGRPPRLCHDPEQPGHRLPDLPGATGRPTCSGPSPATGKPCASTPPRPLPCYAATQNNLGNAYRDLPTGDRAANLQQAIACYREALALLHPRGRPRRLRRDPEQPGHRLPGLAHGDRAANLEQAIACYRAGPALPHPRGRPRRLCHDPEQPGHRLRRAADGRPGGQPGAGDRLLPEPCASAPPRPPRSTTPRPRTTWATPTRTCRRGPGGQPARPSPATGRPCASTPPRPSPRLAMTQNNLGTAYADLPAGDRAANLPRRSPATSRRCASAPPRLSPG